MNSHGSRNNFSETCAFGTFDTSFLGQTSGEYEATIYYPSISSGACTPPDRARAPYPGIVFAHGFACTKDDYRWTGGYLAAHGYVSILFTTPSRFNPFRAFPQCVEGFSRAIDHLASLDRQAGGLLEGMIDEGRIGVIGHSMGAITSLKAAAEDSRVKAVASLAPGYFRLTSFTNPYLEASKSIMVPTQLIMGSKDIICPPKDARSYYDAIPSVKEMLTINGAFHDLGIWNAGNEPYWFEYIPGYDPSRPEYYRNTTRRYFVSWFNYYLHEYLQFQTYIYGREAWKDFELGVLSDLETKRNYEVIVTDRQCDRIEDAEVTLSRQDSTVLWRAFTNRAGKATFNIVANSANYADTLRLRAVKGKWCAEDIVTFLSDSPLLLTLS